MEFRGNDPQSARQGRGAQRQAPLSKRESEELVDGVSIFGHYLRDDEFRPFPGWRISDATRNETRNPEISPAALIRGAVPFTVNRASRQDPL
jgi:hypothetical protein